MPVLIDIQGMSSSSMMGSSSDAFTGNDEFPDFRFNAARRQSQITKFINKVQEGESADKNLDLEKMIERTRKRDRMNKRVQEQKEKEKKEAWCKLKLVWKEEDYTQSRSPQMALEDLIQQKESSKQKKTFKRTRIQYSPKMSHGTERESRRRTNQSVDASRSDSRGRDVSDSDSQMTSRILSTDYFSESVTHLTATGISSKVTEATVGESSEVCRVHSHAVQGKLSPITEYDGSSHSTSQRTEGSDRGTLPRIHEAHEKQISTSYGGSTLSTSRRQVGLGIRSRQFSKNLFMKKKAAGNEESNLFMSTIATPTEKKTKTKKLKHDEKKNIFRSVKVMKTRAENKYKDMSTYAPEIKDKFYAELLVKAFISEQFLGLRLKGHKSEKLRHFYENAVANQHSISTLIIKRPEILPARLFKDLIDFKRQFNVTPVYITTVGAEDKSQWRDFFRKTLSNPHQNVLEEVEKEVPLYPNFYKNLITAREDNIKINPQLLKERKKSSIREVIVHITLQLRMARHVPGSSTRLDMMSIMAASAYNDRLLTMLALSVDDWLDQLTKCLTSNFKSVREETCQVLCFMTKCYPLMKALYMSKYFDVVSDLGNALLRCMDTYEESFEDYYIVLAHLMHYAPSRGLLDCILERHHLFKSVKLMKRWPKLAYYAFKYWPTDTLGTKSPLFGKRVIKMLENALQEPLTQKNARLALYHFQQRYDPVSRLFTIFTDKAEQAHVIALGFREA